MNNVLEMFFSGTFESRINKKMLYYDYQMPVEEINDYVDKIINTPVKDYIDYIFAHDCIEAISSKVVFQFSDFDDATMNICQKISDLDNPGVTYIEAGKILQADGAIRKPGADTKYGENHLKTGALLGLLFELTNTYFLSCIGMVYLELSNIEREKLLTRLILRTKLMYRLMHATKNGDVNVRQFMYMLSDSTYYRRRSNVRKIISMLADSTEYDFAMITNKINL